MKPKRVLLLADSDALWTQRYIQYLLLPEKCEIVIFPIWGDGKRFADFYKEHGIAVYKDTHTLPLVRHVPRLRMWARIALNARDLEKLGPFDVVHNHYLSQRDLALGMRLAKRFRARWICSFWGSDLMRSSRTALRLMASYLKRCDSITVHSELNRDMIRKLYGESAAAKTTLLYFGQIGYQCIDSVRKQADQKSCREYFGIDPERYVICVGYSASAAQQQLAVVEAMSTLPEETQKKIALVLQQTYLNDDPAYVARVREAAGRLSCQTVVLTRFMDNIQSARLRLAADVFILAIKTDAFSGSLQEYLYAGAVVMKGDWLGYPQLDGMGVSVTSFHFFEEIPGLILKAMKGEIEPLTEEQRELFPKLYSWEAVRESWLVLYEKWDCSGKL